MKKSSPAKWLVAMGAVTTYFGFSTQANANILSVTSVYYTYQNPDGPIVGTYSSIQDAIRSLRTVPGGIVKDANWTPVYVQPSYFTYAPNSNTILGVYADLQYAVASLKYLPGGFIKNSDWEIVYAQPYPHYYFTYQNSNSDQITATYTNIQAAVSSLIHTPGGVVKNSDWQIVYTQPHPEQFYSYSAGGDLIGTYLNPQDAVSALCYSPGGTMKDSEGTILYAQPSSGYYFTYSSANANQITGIFNNIQQAVASLKGYPEGIVKNSEWEIVYSQPQYSNIYYTYAAYSNQIVGMYSSLQNAVASMSTLPGGVVKNAQWETVFTQPSPQRFYAYAANDNVILGTYSNLDQAIASLANTPGGVVKNSGWQIIYTQPNARHYFTYSPNSNTILGSYTDVQQAIASLSQTPGGVVKNQYWQIKFTQPQPNVFYTYRPDSSQILGVYDTAQKAIASLGTIPGGVVKNSDWVVIYSQPEFFTHKSYTNELIGTYPSLQDAAGSLTHSPGAYVQDDKGTTDYTQPGTFQTVDLRFPSPSSVTASQIDNWLQKENSPLEGLGSSYITAQNEYGSNATYLLGHSIEESAWGTSSIAQEANNLFGYGAYDSNPGIDAGIYPSGDYAIRFEGWEVRNNYLNSGSSHYGGSPTLEGMLEGGYATDPAWANNISGIMGEYVQQTGGSLSDYPEYMSGSNASLPQYTEEPVYYLNGATGTVGNNISNYPGILPVFNDMASGEDNTFPGIMSLSDENTYIPAVATLQKYLNQNGATLTADGYFGPKTQAAVESFQRLHGLSAPGQSNYGECDYTLWRNVYPTMSIPAGSTINIYQIKQGMFDGYVTEWYYVKDTSSGNEGWVNSRYVTFNNVYRIFPTSGSNILVNGHNLHVGDYVVSNSPGTIQFADAIGNLYQGSIGSTATLKQISH